MIVQQTEVGEIVDFIFRECEGVYIEKQRRQLLDAIGKHLEWGTIMIIREESTNEITAIARWNWENPQTAHVLDVVIKKGYRKPLMLRQLVALGKEHYPDLKWIKFERLAKYPKRKQKEYSVYQLLKTDKIFKRSELRCWNLFGKMN